MVSSIDAPPQRAPEMSECANAVRRQRFHCNGTRLRKGPSRTLALFALAGVGSPAAAQDIEPRAYSNAPVGVNF
jgi:hypothetical protein